MVGEHTQCGFIPYILLTRAPDVNEKNMNSAVIGGVVYKCQDREEGKAKEVHKTTKKADVQGRRKSQRSSQNNQKSRCLHPVVRRKKRR